MFTCNLPGFDSSRKKIGMLGSVSLFALLAMSCGKKSDSSDEIPDRGSCAPSKSLLPDPACTPPEDRLSKTGITDAETSTVTAASAELQLTSSLVLLPAKSETAASLAEDDNGNLRLRVENDAFEGVGQINNILCYFSQTKFWEQEGKGVYKVMVDEKACDKKSGGENSGGGQNSSSSEGQQVSYMTAYVRASREKEKALVGEIRFVAEEGEYHARIVVAAPPSEEYPAGIFTMHYTPRMGGKAAGYGQIKARASADGKKYILEHIEVKKGGGREGNDFTTAELERVGSEFVGKIVSSSKGSEENAKWESDFKVRFDKDLVNSDGKKNSEHQGHKQNSTIKGCYDRNKFKTNIYRYDLVDSAGKLKKLNSGFPIEAQAGGKTYQGNAGYHGIWLPNEAEVQNGQQVQKLDWSGNGKPKKTPHTVVKAPGKLIKFTKASVTLGALKGVDLNIWENGTNFIARWDGSKLTKVAKMVQSDRGPGSEEAVSPAQEVTSQNGWPVNLWISSLNANINIPSADLASLSDTYAISYHKQQVVSGSASDLGELVCFSNCPVMKPQAADFSQGQSGGFGQASNLYVKIAMTNNGGGMGGPNMDGGGMGSNETNQASNVSTPLATYTWNATDRVIQVGGDSFALPADLPKPSMQGGEGGGGTNIFSGALVPKAVWDTMQNKASTDPWKMENSLDVFYRWESGVQPWSQFTALKDASGALVVFDQPLEFSYVHAKANDFDGNNDSNVVGKTFRLNYGGPGQLWGIPWKFNQAIGYEMPLFSLRGGTKLGDFIVRPLEGEQRMQKTADGKCKALALSDLPKPPKPDNKEINNSKLGDDNSPLRYIGGVAVSQ